MKFTETKLPGAFIIDLVEHCDERGFFARSWCQKEFEAAKICFPIVQSNIAFNRHAGTIRGMHYQTGLFAEVKLVRCTKGSVYDVIIDLRPASPTFKRWIAVELSADNHRAILVPEHFAHGYQTLEDESEIFYMVSQFYNPLAEHGVRWNDPAFGISWPMECRHISAKDAAWPDYQAS